MNIWMNEKALTNGSTVYDVNIDNCLHLLAITKQDGIELCAKLAEAIEAHTNITVESDH